VAFQHENAGVVLSQLQSRISAARISSDAMRTLARWTAAEPAVGVVCGREQVVAMQGMLVELSRRTGQFGAMDWLDYYVNSPDSLEKTPYVLLVGRNSAGNGLPDALQDASAASADGVRGAVLMYEYRFAGHGTKVFATDDMIGIRTVIAPEETRVEVAEVAIRRLMGMGAVMALISLDGGLDGQARPVSEGRPAYRSARRTRVTPRCLALGRTLDETLARLGKHTRRNLRYYRRRLETDFGAEFVPEVEMRREEFLEMNRRSTNPAAEDVMDWRFSLIERSRMHPGTMFAGLRAADGRWLSLIGGRRHGQTTELDWQMNLAGLPHYSLCTAMRAYLLEEEIARGVRKLVCQGGTPHPMRFAFSCAETTDILAVRRWSTRAWLLRRFSRWIFPEKNFLAATLREMQGGTAEEPRSPAGLANAA
jgi:hypothetical protein